MTQHDTLFFENVEKKVKTRFILYPSDSEKKVLENMNRLDKMKRKIKIEFLVKGKDEKF